VREAVVPFDDGMGAKLSDVVELVHAGLSRTKNTPEGPHQGQIGASEGNAPDALI
jgi:hypothetical protein